MENNNKDEIVIQRIIQRCGCDKILPITLVYILYIILHGHISPGGGFQGGILMVAAVVLTYLGHGYQEAKRFFVPNIAHPLEGAALMAYILISFCGVVFAAQFCQNFAYLNGDIGALISSGTISWMDEAVAFNVMTASIMLTIGMLSVLYPLDIDNTK